MRLCTKNELLICFLYLPSLLLSLSLAYGETAAPLQKELVWSQPQSEIADVQFSSDGNFIVLVSRVHWPDGEEAEQLPEQFFKKLEQQKQKDARFADPVVKLIDLKGNLVCEARYGTHPSVSPDNTTLVFAHQKQPISGLRPLAETLAGNDIQLFDCEKKQSQTIARPKEGYLDRPFFSRNGHSVIYTRNEAVNGAMGGPVAVMDIDLPQGTEKVLFAKTSTASIPCPAGSAIPGFQALMCGQLTKLSSSFPDLILGFIPVGDELLLLTGRPLPAPGDIYLAKDYDVNLISVFPERDNLLSFGKTGMGKLSQTSVQPLTADRVMIFREYWRPFSAQGKNWLPESGPRNENRRSFYSPDMKYYVAPEPAEQPDHLALYGVADGQRVMDLPKMTNIYEATWSSDSKRVAIVELPRGVFGASYKEELVVFSVR